MNLVELLDALGRTKAVTWRSKDDGRLVRITGRDDNNLLVVDYQQEPDGSWVQADVAWEVPDFLRAFDPVR